MKQLLKISLILSLFFFGIPSLIHSSEAEGNDIPIVLDPVEPDQTSHGPRMPAKAVVYAIVGDNSIYLYSSIDGIFNIQILDTEGRILVDEYASLIDGYTIEINDSLDGLTIIASINDIDYTATL